MDWSVNWWAVLVAGLIYFVLGWVWFSPVLFAKPWMAELKISPAHMNEDARKRMPFLMAGALLTGLLLAWVLALLVHRLHLETIAGAIRLSLALGLLVLAAPMANSYAFSGRSLKLYLIDLGMPVVGIVVMTVLLVAWP